MYRNHQEEIDAARARQPVEARAAYPHLRAACFCPICGVEKQRDLVSCWSCWRELEKLSDDVVAAELAEYEADEARAVEAAEAKVRGETIRAVELFSSN